MNPCQAWQDQIWLALDGELEEGASVILVAHVRGCLMCRNELNGAIRVQRALLMDAVGITGAATAPTVALRAVRSPSGTRRSLVTRPLVTGPLVPRTPRAARRRTSGNRFIMPVAIVVSLMFLALLLVGPGRTRVVPALSSKPDVATSVTVSRSAVSLAHLTQAVGVSVDGHTAALGAGVGADVPVVVEGSARLLLNDGTTLQLTSGTRLSLHRGGHRRAGGAVGLLVMLSMGSVDAEVTPQSAEAPLVITSPVAEVTVVGTALQVSHDATASRIQVTHGQVRVAADAMPERLLGAGESMVVPLGSLVAGLVSFVVTKKMDHGGTVPQWCDQLGLDPQHRVVAVPGAGEQPPHYKEVNGHPALCLNGVNASLTFPLSTWKTSMGLTVLLVARPAGSGADGLESLLSVSDVGGEHLAVVRSRCVFGVTTGGKTVLEESDADSLVLTCTWSSAGVVTLLHDHRVVASATGPKPGTLTDAVLGIAHGPQGKRFEGNVFMLEVQQGVPSEAALHLLIDDLLHRYGACP